jgi:hypothetical protein
MSRIEHTIEPERLWLVWQPQDPSRPRSRRIVAEIVREDDSGATLRYLPNTDDFKLAVTEGFQGYPAFKIAQVEHRQGVLDAFIRRLPPRNREDFSEYLERHRLPERFEGSEMALLAYTGAKLPGDGFELCADFESTLAPFELVIEVAGFRHQSDVSISNILVGERVEFISEPANPTDNQAIAVHYGGRRIGYVGRHHLRAFHAWIKRGYKITALVDRLNGKPERPLVYLFVAVRML